MKNAVRPVGSERLFQSFQLALEADGLRPHTISCYLRDVRRFRAYSEPTEPGAVTSDEVRRWVKHLTTSLSPKTVKEAQMGLGRFSRFLVAEGEINTNPATTVKLTKFKVRPQPTYTLDEVKQLLRSCRPDSKKGVRNAAIVSVPFDTGVREGELVSMGIPDWSSSTVMGGNRAMVAKVTPLFMPPADPSSARIRPSRRTGSSRPLGTHS